jgi:hypothetical protein
MPGARTNYVSVFDSRDALEVQVSSTTGVRR